MTLTAMDDDALQKALAQLDEQPRLAARTIANAWESAGGTVKPGKVAVRLIGHQGDSPFTAATLFCSDARLELCRVIMEHHGLPPEAFQHWADEILDIAIGFDPSAKYPSLPLDLDPARLVRVVNSIRDLAQTLHA